MFCLPYYPYYKYVEEADELKVPFRLEDRTLPLFLDEHKEKSIIIDITNINFDNLDKKLFEELYNQYKNIKFLLSIENKEILDFLKEKNIPYFFCEPVTTIDKLTGFLEYHPTDMYICEELGFSLDKVSKILHDHNIKVRVYPNVCQSSYPDTPSIKKFFIRPEDISNYSIYVDVFDLTFWKDEPVRLEVVFKAYKQEKWFGEINEIIPTFKGTLNGKYILGNFGVTRAVCGKRCMYKPGSCDVCGRFIETADFLKKNYIVVNKKQKN